MSNEMIVQNWQPVATLDQARGRYQALAEFVKAIMRPEVDFGIIPGTNKNTLLKPGAEKLATFFGLATDFVTVTATEDWTGEDHQGEPFFYYRVKCSLSRGGQMVASAEGSANSWEKKYRYRAAERVCLKCGNPTIIKGKEEYGGGWLCFAKKGGCGAKYGDGDPAITGQQVGQVKNPDIADAVNTILKMSQKRALVAAVLIAVNGSDYFTQDMEDLDFGVVVESEARPVVSPKPPMPREEAPAPTNGKPIGKSAERPFDAETIRDMLRRKASKLDKDGEQPTENMTKMVAPHLAGLFLKDKADDHRHMFTYAVFNCQSTKELTPGQVIALERWMAYEKNDAGEWVPDLMAIHEARAVVDEFEYALADMNGQTENG